MYSVEVALSTDSSSGKVNAIIAPRACADAAGNLLQRSNLSSSVIRFGESFFSNSKNLTFQFVSMMLIFVLADPGGFLYETQI